MPYHIKVFASLLMTPELEKAVNVVDTVLHGFGLHAVITSGNDGRHSNDSFHYRNQALDFRKSDWPKQHVLHIVDLIKNNLGPGYDCVLELTHLHVEYDPER